MRTPYPSIFFMNDTRTPEETKKVIEQLNADIIELERKMEKTHDESGGNSPDDNSQEAATDYISRASIGREIEEKRRRIGQLEDELSRSK